MFHKWCINKQDRLRTQRRAVCKKTVFYEKYIAKRYCRKIR
jgi:hypothetical protein